MKPRFSKYISRFGGGCTLALLMTLFIGGACYAETVSQKASKTLAQTFFDKAYGEHTPPPKYVWNGKRLTTDRLFTPFYVYNSPRGGFVIISAENKAFPILGYSLKSSFDPDKLSEGERAWLGSYAKDIELIRYDSREPTEAIAAWQDFGEYTDRLLKARYSATDPAQSVAEAEEELERVFNSDQESDNGNYSILYTPESWRDMIDGAIAGTGSIAMGYVDWNKNLHPATIYGKQGDYYRIRFDRLNDWLLRMSATELLADRFVASFNPVPEVRYEDEEERPFDFMESIIAEHSALETSVKEMNIEDEITAPIVKANGGGHFEILLPENVKLAMMYSLTGQHIGRRTYHETPLAHIDIEAQPTGFYFVILYGESGTPYGFKLYR